MASLGNLPVTSESGICLHSPKGHNSLCSSGFQKLTNTNIMISLNDCRKGKMCLSSPGTDLLRRTEKERGKTMQPLIISAWHTRCDGVAARWLLPPASLHPPFKITQKMKSVCYLYQLRPSSQYTTDSSTDTNEVLLSCFPGQPISHLSVGTRNRQRLWSASHSFFCSSASLLYLATQSLLVIQADT